MSSRTSLDSGPVKSVDDLAKRRDLLAQQKSDGIRIQVCTGRDCVDKGATAVYEQFVAQAAQPQPAASESSAKKEPIVIDAVCTGCHGLCGHGPIVTVNPGNVLYCNVTPDDVEEILQETNDDNIVERLLYKDPDTDESVKSSNDISFYSHQARSVLADVGQIDPMSIEDYIRSGGFGALAKALSSMAPDDVIEEVERSQLTGRSGGVMPTAQKWRDCRDASGSSYIICNGDESDPDASMDRALMEGNPFLVLEGLILGGYAIGATTGYLYVRDSYESAVERIDNAVQSALTNGFLGSSILGSDFGFDIRVFRGGDAFVCGETTALIASIEGMPPIPRDQYVPVAEKGFHGKPTVLNNVETLANIPQIVEHGGKAFAGSSKDGSSGTKTISLSGSIPNTGIAEVPMGTPLREIVEEIGGAVPDSIKAVRTGGPLGGCLPGHLLDTPLDYTTLEELGATMGTGGIHVMDENTCMVGFARETLEFLKGESCGKCTACREGVAQMHHILDRIGSKQGTQKDIEILEGLAGLIFETALCDLGRNAPNIVISTLHHFRDEYDVHIDKQECPAKACKGMFAYEIVPEACKGCGICLKNCPVDAITGERREPHLIDGVTCTNCGTCYEKCPFDAIIKV